MHAANEKRLALCIGHSRLVSGKPEGGARSVGGMVEWDFWKPIASGIAEILHDCYGISCLVIDRYEGANYGAAMRWLGQTLRAEGDIALAVELHFNAANGTARGHEWLHWKNSPAGKRAAVEMHLAMIGNYPLSTLPARGAKGRNSKDRGAGFLQHTPCPAVIAEPFFGDNATDWQMMHSRPAHLALTMARGLANAFQAVA